jgi:hypothetical protein
MSIDVEFEGIDELRAACDTAHERLVTGLRSASLAAAAAGIEEARSNHPYTDRTYSLSGDAHAEQVEEEGALEAEMVWPVRYAGFVDEGTARNKPYPFTPQACRVAETTLEQETNSAVDTALEGLR